MTHVTTFTYAIWAYLTAGWTSLSALGDVISGTFAASDGMATNKNTDRVGGIGQFEFDLKNFTSKYSPGHINALAGWDNDIPVKVVMSYDGIDYLVYGRIAPAPDGITLQAGEKGAPRVHVVCLDFMSQASEYPIVNPGILTSKTGAQIMTATLALMPIQPQSTNLGATVNTFAYAFDTNTSKTKAYAEASKVAFSECGYAYVRPDKTYGEKFVLESATRRSGLDTETPIPITSTMSGYKLREDGGYKLREDGGYKLRDETETLTAATTQINITDFDITRGTNLVNRISGYAYPRKLDASVVVLFRLSQPLAIAPGQTITIKGTFADPAGGLPVNGQGMIAPTATTDYLFNELPTGLGTDHTADIVIVSAPYGTEGFTHQVKNNGSYFGYLVQYNTRGYGIYQYNPLEHTASSAASIAARGVRSDALHQQYQQSPAYGALFTNAWVEYDKFPETRINSITFCANYSPTAMQAFLNLGTGDLIRVQDTKTATDAQYYIQGRSYQILPGRIVMVTWILKETLNLVLGLSMIGVSFSGTIGSTDAIRHGYVPWISNLSARTYSAWIYPVAAGDIQVIMGNDAESGNGGGVFRMDWGDSQRVWLTVQYNHAGVGAIAAWKSRELPLNTWYHIVITQREDDTSATAATLYINGVAETFTRALAGNAAGATMWDETDSPFSIGNATAIGTDNNFPGSILAPRIYNRELTAAEALALYTAGPDATNTVTSGLVYQGFCVPTKHKADYIGTLTSEDKLWDNIYKIVGEPAGAPVGFNSFASRSVPSFVSVSTTTGANVTSTTHAHTIAAGDNRLLVVLVSKRAYNDITSVTFGGAALTRFDSQYYAVNNYPEYEIWYKVAPAVSTANVVVTLPSGDYVTVTAINFTNADQIMPFWGYTNAIGTGTTPSLSMLALTPTLIVDILSIEKGGSGVTLTATAGQTQRSNITSDNSWSGAVSTKPGAGTTATSWTVSTSPHNWVYGALAILGAQ